MPCLRRSRPVAIKSSDTPYPRYGGLPLWLAGWLLGRFLLALARQLLLHPPDELLVCHLNLASIVCRLQR